jgi:hypothetical protein
MTNVSSDAHTEGHKIPLPPDWAMPQFHFGQTVASTEGSGEIVGLSYIRPTKPIAAKLGTGWQYHIDIADAATNHQVFPVEILPESQVWEVDAT